MDYSGVSISKEIENQVKQNQQLQPQTYVPAILSKSRKQKVSVSSENQQYTINGVQNRNSQQEIPATSSGIPSDTWEKAAGDRNFGHAENFSLAGWNKIPCKNLMAWAEKGQINTNLQQQSSATMYQSHYGGSNTMMSSNTPSQIRNYGFHEPYHPDCRTSSLPMGGGSIYGGTIPVQHLAPATPNIGKRLDNQVSESSSTCLSKQINHENERQQEVMENTEFSATEQSSHHSSSQVDSSSAVLNAPENESHTFGKEVEGIVDLNATPASTKKRRKKHRPKVVIEGKPKRTPKPKTPQVGESKTGKRRYVRKKSVQANESPSMGLKDNADPTLMGLKDNADPTWEPDPKRVLDFEVDAEARDTNHKAALDHQNSFGSLNSEFPAPHDSSGIRSSNQNKSIQQGKPTGFQFDLNLSCDDSHSFQESHEQRREESRSITVSESANKDDVGYSYMPRSRGMKRQYYQAINENPHSMNIHGAQLNSMPMYRNVFKGKDLLLDTLALFFPHQKKRRTEKGQSMSATSSTRKGWKAGEKQAIGWGQAYQKSNNFAPKLKDMQASSSFLMSNTTGTNIMNGQSKVVGGQFGNLQSSLQMMNFGQVKSRKQRTKTSPKRRSVASLTAMMGSNQFPSTPLRFESSKGGKRRNDDYSGQSQASRVLALDNYAKIIMKKQRTKRGAPKVDSASDMVYVYEHEMASFNSQYHRGLLYGVDDILPLDQLVQKFCSISITRESSSIMQEYNNAIIPFVRTPAIMQRCNEVVPFDRVQGSYSKALVIIEPKKRKPRAKVDLDPETDRVWKQLMGKECDQGEGTDVDKEKWWEEERRVFRGRADSFIARMHQIQGDRRFTKWKGSVVDSVIGVFLTQNVSDHLSSSAFMSLASRFPLQSTSSQRTCYEDGTQVIVEEPDEPEQCQNLSAEPVCDQGSITVQEIEHVEERESYSVGSPIPSSSLLNELEGEQVAVHQSESGCVEKSTEIQHFLERVYIRTAEDAFSPGSSISSSTIHSAEQILAMEKTNACLADSKDSAAVEDIVSSQNLVISSQTSESSVIQTAELIGSCSGSNSEAEDVVIACEPNPSDAAGPFTTLLQMVCTKRSPGCFLDRPDAPTDSYLPASNSNLSVPESGSTLSSNDPLHTTPDLRVLEAESLKAPGLGSTGQDSSSKVNSPETAKNYVGIPNDSPPGAQGPPSVQSSCNSFEQTSNLEKNQCSKEFQGERSVLQHENTQLVEHGDPVETPLQIRNGKTQQASSSLLEYPRENSDVEKTTHLMASQTIIQNKRIDLNLNGHIQSTEISFGETTVIASVDTPKAKRKSVKEKKEEFDWDSLRRDACHQGAQRKRTADTMDTLDYEAVRCAEVSEIAKAIRERGMNNMLGERIKDFLNRIVREHGSIDLEWLRDVPPDKAKDYLLSIRGLGLKSVECVRLLTLHQLAFPVDTNVGRIAVRLGWVPLQPLPEEVQLHLLELYPMLESIQKYLWPRLCKLDQPTLYELHYQMITFGKVFCTKHKPNCNACPMRAECRHFASAFASARLALPAPQEKGIVPSNVPLGGHSQAGVVKGPQLSLQEPFRTVSRTNECEQRDLSVRAIYPTITCEHQDYSLGATSRTNQCEPIVEVPASPEPEPIEEIVRDIEDAFLNGDPEENQIRAIDVNIEELEELSLNVQKIMQENNMQVHIDAVSTALVASKASIPMPKLKNVGRLRTEHLVYELPDNHILLKGRDRRETDDPSPYMLAIWTPGEIADSTQPGEQNCVMQGTGNLCNNITCWSCNNAREKESHIVRGTLLIPCRTATRGSFPLNGTYFQVNEVFADDDSSRNPIEVPRSYLWNLPLRIVYFGTSATSIFKGLSTDAIQNAFWRGFVCVRGFDHKARAPRPLYARLHLAASRMGKNGAKIPEE
ncbi:hypothetical protein MKW94_009611 [Papaver nudicaule]|uniref:HhH-GPD domain-containing protein n=1 Tax=Papaver nudicaule TaxID=74823 RepID=A0AA42B026_PAPNU|nr:hypothetical protein [Papaver nudicaule]